MFLGREKSIQRFSIMLHSTLLPPVLLSCRSNIYLINLLSPVALKASLTPYLSELPEKVSDGHWANPKSRAELLLA